MRISYDPTVGAAYIYLSDAMVLVTRRLSETVLIDLDADANVIGVELLDVDAPVVEDITRRRRRGAGGEGEAGQ